MKGQYTVVQELLLFAIGILVVVFVVSIFSNIEDTVTEYTVAQNIEKIGNRIMNGITKVLENEEMNATIVIEVPILLSNHVYKISIGRELNISTKVATFSQNIFNISNKYNISGEAMSSAGRIKIEYNQTHITLRRFV